MPVVKSGQSVPMLRNAVVLEMGDVEAHALGILRDADARAAAAVEEAERRAAHLTANADQKGHVEGFQRGMLEGREKGLRDGRDEALAESRERFAAIAERWTAAIDEWEANRERLFDEAREDVLRFAFALAERVVHRLVRADANIVADQMRTALEHLSRPTVLQVSIHPDDRASVEQTMPDVAASLGRSAHVHLHDDPTLDRGGCVVATAGGYVDASIATQLDRLAEALLREGRLIEKPPLEAIHLAGRASAPRAGTGDLGAGEAASS
jgi:flagellar assembly protein FliH